MRSIIFYFLIAISFFSSCNNGKQNNSIAQKGTEESTEKEEVAEYSHSAQMNKKKLSKSMFEKGIKLTLNGPCDDAIFDSIHKRRTAYIDTIDIENKVLVTFRFIDDCCKEFLADYTIHADTMLIELGLVNDEVCECKCWYRYRFETAHKGEKINHIKVRVDK